jgi:outer membrane protein assembly factor BamB
MFSSSRGRWPRRRIVLGGVLVAVLAAAVVAALVLITQPGDVSNPGVGFTEEQPGPAPATHEPGPGEHPMDDGFAWPNFRLTRTRTGDLPLRGRLRPPFVEQWKVTGRILLEFPPVSCRRSLYLLKNNAALYRISRLTGRVAWKRKLGYLAAASPSCGGRSVYVVLLERSKGARAGRVVALDVKDGRTRWSRRLPSRAESSPLLAAGRLYFGTEDGTVYALRAKDGSKVWTYHAGGAVKAALAYNKGMLFFGDYSGTVTALRAKDGSRAWDTGTNGRVFNQSGQFYSTPAVAFGRVYSGNLDHRVYSFEAKDGSLAWSHSTGGYVYSAPAVADVPGTRPSVYIGSYDHNFYALDAQTGAVRWTYHASGPISGAATVIGRIVYFGTLQTHNTIGLDVRSGRRVFAFSHGAYNPAISDGQRLYITGFSSEFGLEPRHKPKRHRAHRRGRPIRLRSHTVAVRRARVRISVRCPADARRGCRGRLKLRLENRSGRRGFLGRARFAVDRGRAAGVPVQISRFGINRLRHSSRHHRVAVLYVIAADHVGTVRSTRGRVTLTIAKAGGRR